MQDQVSDEKSSMEMAFDEICEFNNIKNKSPQVVNAVTRIDIFQFFYVHSLDFAVYFSGLTELCINHQKEMTSLKGIGSCVNLRRVWVSNCSLEAIHPDIDSCRLLQKLDLSDNMIRDIQNLDNLQELQSLLLCSNKIKSLKGVVKLKNLEELWLARNCIEKIGTSLDGLERLKVLNLAQNKISSFKQVLNLSRLASLRMLSLKDPHYGANPVCALSNYQTYVLCHVSQVETFDTLVIKQEAKLLTEATFLKKRMYYNMRIKTLKRNTTNVIHKAVECKQNVISVINLTVSVLLRQRQEVKRVLEEQEYYENEKDPEFTQKLENKLKVLEDCINKRGADIRDIIQKCDLLEREVRRIADEAIQHLLLELETGGNIRLVEGKETDDWYTACTDLLQSRILLEEYQKLGICELKVKRVIRIHNRHLKNRFDEHVELLEQVADSEEETKIDYLLFQGHQSFVDIAQDGFMEPQKYRSQCGYRHAAIPMQNFLFGDELQSKLQGNYHLYRNKTKGRVVISKAYLGKIEDCSQALMNIASNKPVNSMLDPQEAAAVIARNSKEKLLRCSSLSSSLQSLESSSEISSRASSTKRKKRSFHSSHVAKFLQDYQEEIWGNGNREVVKDDEEDHINPHNFPGYQGVTLESESGDPKHQSVYLFDRALIVPQFIVEFEYVTVNEKLINQMHERDASDHAGNTNLNTLDSMFREPLSKQEMNDLGPLIHPLMAYISDVKVYAQNTGNGNNTTQIIEQEQYNEVVNMEPQLAARESLSVITEQVLVKWTGLSDISKLTYVNLHGNNIRQLEGLESLVNLKTLVCSFNELHKIEGLEANTQLERLELGFNLIKRIEGMETLSMLRKLELNNNLIYRLEDLDSLSTNHPHLVHVNLQNNAMCEVRHYKDELLLKLPQLEILDGTKLSKMDRDTNSLGALVITPAVIYSNAFKSIEKVDGSGIYFTAKQDDDPAPVPSTNDGTATNEDWWQRVERLELNRSRVHTLESMEKLVNLRRASFANNEIVTIEGLETCTRLEELCLEENRISKISGLSTCTFLKKLDLGKNKLTKIEGLDALVNLTQLSLEDNDIRSLTGLSKLPSLMELYIGNNRICSLKEIHHLRGLRKLIIMDLLGNPISKEEFYRLYAVFYLKKLKVLDGIGIDAAEQTAAKEKYSGKLSMEFLNDKIGHKYYEHIHELDLASCRIRDIELYCLCGSKFSSLRELNLSNNSLTNLNGLSFLPTLQVLRANHNRIESLRAPGGADSEALIGLRGIPNLEVLQLGFNKISDISALSLNVLPNLKILFLQGNEISQINGLNECTELRELVLDKNKFRSLDHVHENTSGLINLRALRLEENSIRTLGYLRHLVKLHSLYLGYNRISEFTELQKLECIPFLLELSISNNPVSRKQMYRPTLVNSLPTLKFIDGREVSQDEKERVNILFSTPEATAQYPDIQQHQSQLRSSIINGPTTNTEQNDGQAILSITGKLPVKVQLASSFVQFSPSRNKSIRKAKPRASLSIGNKGSSFLLPQVGSANYRIDKSPKSVDNSRWKLQGSPTRHNQLGMMPVKPRAGTNIRYSPR